MTSAKGVEWGTLGTPEREKKKTLEKRYRWIAAFPSDGENR